MTKNTNSIDMTLVNADVGFAALRRPYEGAYGPSYTIALEFDANEESANLDILGKLTKVLTKGRPVDVKDESGLKSTGKLKLFFSSDNPIDVFDADGEQIPQELIPSVGKGSKVNVQFRVAQTKHGMFKYIKAIQLVEVVEYLPQKSSSSFSKVKGGFTLSKVLEKDTSEADFESVFSSKK